MLTMHRAELLVFADFHQFYLMDGGVAPEAPIEWSDQDINLRVKVASNVVVVCPVRNMSVPVTIEVCSAEPSVNLDEFDQVVRCSINLPTG